MYKMAKVTILEMEAASFLNILHYLRFSLFRRSNFTENLMSLHTTETTKCKKNTRVHFFTSLLCYFCLNACHAASDISHGTPKM